MTVKLNQWEQGKHNISHDRETQSNLTTLVRYDASDSYYRFVGILRRTAGTRARTPRTHAHALKHKQDIDTRSTIRIVERYAKRCAVDSGPGNEGRFEALKCVVADPHTFARKRRTSKSR